MYRFHLILNGEAPEQQGPCPAADLIIAADGGYRHVVRWQWTPDVVVGDLDSIGDTGNVRGALLHMEDQQLTDFQKAIGLLPNVESATVDAWGGLGLRADHEMTNRMVASTLPPAWHLTMHGRSERITRVTPECPWEANLLEGETVSLLPDPAATGVEAVGLRWVLHGATLEAGGQLGQSNRALGGPVAISCTGGRLWVWTGDDQK